MTDATPLASKQITQEDREAAWKYRPACYWLGDDTMEKWMAGAYDTAAPVIVDFAHHRIAALSATPAPSDQAGCPECGFNTCLCDASPNNPHTAVEYPAGAIENGREFLRRLGEYDCEAGPISMSVDYIEAVRCFEWLVMACDRMMVAPSDQDASQAQGEVERLTHVIDRNRYTAAACVNAVEYVLHTRRWLREAGRGSYAYDDERYQQEFGLAFDEIMEALRPMRAVAIDKSDCTTDLEKVRVARVAGAERFAAALSPAPGATAQDGVKHPDDVAVDLFAARMKAKLAAARAKGRGGWDDPAQCSVDYLRTLLHEHVAKGDPVDVANFCMMLAHYGASTAPTPTIPAGMVAHTGRYKPDDWNGGKVLLKDMPGSLGGAPEPYLYQPEEDVSFVWDNQKRPHVRIIAYTPLAAAPKQAEQQGVEIDWSEPLEAVHNDGRIEPATAHVTGDNYAQWVTWRHNAGWIDYHTGTSEDHPGWRIRNVAALNAPTGAVEKERGA